MLRKTLLIYVVALLLFFFVTQESKAQDDRYSDECVTCWAEKLGKELWDLGQIITKSSEIKHRYSFLNAQVEEKKPRVLLAEIIENIARMMDRKMDAVLCIVQKAEEVVRDFEFNETAADDFMYYSSKYSCIEYFEDNETIVECPKDESEYYNNMTMSTDKHFYNLLVNTSYSSVHVPSNVFDRHENALVDIQWTEALNDVFTKNYQSDPSLSWQYFASTAGIMRHYPAIRWSIPYDIDVFDARIRTWFIEAATCTKDVVILLDNSGSMAGMRKHIAKFAVRSILDTFSNNDYINVLNYSKQVNYTVGCFKDMLVQATKENILVFKNAIEYLKPNEKSYIDNALNESLALLKRYREARGCEIDTRACNQAIMIITDGVTETFKELFEHYNSMYGNRTSPVRVFTYLVGKEVSHVAEIREMACANRGYYSHVDSLEQVSASVFNYVAVIARPLVLEADHPASWTHAYPDQTAKVDNENDTRREPYRLLASVAVPAFNYIGGLERNETSLLGVAGTDVPIEDIGKLTLPYKIGVNGYAFVVSNNGYVIMHPDLRPLFEGRLKENSNSVDFTEVEQHYDQTRAREISPVLEQLRNKLVMGEEGSMHNITLKYHYDDNRRISKESYDYYFAPLNKTPFTVGIAIPSIYGKYHIDVGDQIQKNKHTGIKIESYFSGNNWKVHPKWIYCRYHYLEGHDFDTPEKELEHFLHKMRTLYRGFVWRRQFEAMVKAESEGGFEKEDLDAVECGRETLKHEDYYCDKQLVNRLIFDATSTYEAFKTPWAFKDDREQEAFERYNASLRFVATTSGLTRWEYIYGEDETNPRMEFGDWHARAVNENWYKNAIVHYQHDRNSFVYSVPFDSGADEETLVTGSYAIFHKDAGREAPAAVVGFQFSHSLLVQRLKTIMRANSGSCQHCVRYVNDIDYYIIDAHGYVLVSHNDNDTGRFLGTLEGAVFESMVKRFIFEKITIFDFQGVCKDEPKKKSDAANFLTPFTYIGWGIKMMISRVVWFFLELNLHQLWDPNWVIADDDDDDEEKEESEEDLLRSCDKKRDLYVVNSSIFTPGHAYYKHKSKDVRAYSIKRIPHSNLLMVVVEPFEQQKYIKFNVDMQEIIYENITYPCQKLNLNNLTRRRLSGCYNQHPLEKEILDCGRSSIIVINNSMIIISLLLCYIYNLST